MPVDTYMIFLERGRELIAAQFVGVVVIKKIIVLYYLLPFN